MWMAFVLPETWMDEINGDRRHRARAVESRASSLSLYLLTH
jgi:hypothetical protein